MWLPALLLSYAAAGTYYGPTALQFGGWDSRNPRQALLAWQAALLSVTAAAGIGLLTVSHHGWEALLTWALHAEYRAVHTAYGLTSATWVEATATVTGTVLLSRLLWAVTTTALAVRRQRQVHRELLRVLCRPVRTTPGVVSVVDADEPAVYCLPGPHARTVVTSAALRRLTPDQFAAALAHERAHLRARHHWLLSWGLALRTGFGSLPLFATFGKAAARLVELAADDEAARRHGRRTTAAALLALSGDSAPAGSLSAGGSTAERIARLVGPRPRRATPILACMTVLIGAVLVFPASVALIPGIGLVGSAH